MLPVLFKIGVFELHSYGVALAISVLMGILVARKRAPRFGVDQNTILDLAIVIMLAAIIGSRLWYVVNHLNEFRGHWFDIINPFRGEYIGIAGLSMVGGVVLAIISSAVYAWKKKLNFVVLENRLIASWESFSHQKQSQVPIIREFTFGQPSFLLRFSVSRASL